jgi:hypothetical protein
LNDDERKVWIFTDEFFYGWAKSAGVKFWERRWLRWERYFAQQTATPIPETTTRALLIKILRHYRWGNR